MLVHTYSLSNSILYYISINECPVRACLHHIFINWLSAIFAPPKTLTLLCPRAPLCREKARTSFEQPEGTLLSKVPDSKRSGAVSPASALEYIVETGLCRFLKI